MAAISYPPWSDPGETCQVLSHPIETTWLARREGPFFVTEFIEGEAVGSNSSGI